jgi:hypothetical protein
MTGNDSPTRGGVLSAYMPQSLYAREVECVQKAIGLLRDERDASLIRELEEEQLAAGTSLEWYGITQGAFERFLASRPLSEETRAALRDGVRAVRVIYGSEKA